MRARARDFWPDWGWSIKSGSSGLGKKIILENFHRIGKYDSLRIALNMCVISTMTFGRLRLIATSAVNRSNQGDIVSVYFWMVRFK